jgi:hypothetical protein
MFFTSMGTQTALVVPHARERHKPPLDLPYLGMCLQVHRFKVCQFLIHMLGQGTPDYGYRSPYLRTT